MQKRDRESVVARRHNPNGTVTLAFDDGAQGVFVVRGGVCWPMPSPVHPGIYLGYMAVAARDTETGKVYVFEEAPFTQLDHVLERGRIVHVGAAATFQRWWSTYGVLRWFVNQEADTCARYGMLLRRCESVQPKPRIKEITWGNSPYPLTDLDAGRVVYRANGGIAEALVRFRTMPQRFDLVPCELRALSCALCGLERVRDVPLTVEQQMAPE